MQVLEVPAGTGWRWMLEGFRLMRRRPLALLGMTVLFLFTIVLPTVIPVVGGFAPLVLTPALAVGFMRAVRIAEAGAMPAPWTLFSALGEGGQKGLRALLLLGAINCVLTVAVLAVSMFADGGTLFRIATGAIGNDDPALSQGSVIYAALVFLVLYTPVQMAMWYAPVFVAWHGLHPVKALFYSLFAVWRNRGAFVVYLVAWFAVAVGLSVLVQVTKAVVPPGVLPMLLSPLSLVMLCALYCSFWPTYRDVVADLSPPPPVSPPTTPAT